MPLPPGTRLGPYTIVAPLGQGGMGEVFKAQDTRLGRTVAIKVLTSALAADPDVRARFEREAQAIASLAHPHICTLFDVGASPAGPGVEGVSFLVMELLEGETLRERLARGALPMAEALTIAIQVAGALACAHQQGIVHRDLKPANIMLTQSGAKLLDFGLARLRPGQRPTADATQTAALTTYGTVLGTLQYIAPEQLEGAEVDGRADLFAFGAIVYEMLSGRPAFDAASAAGLIGAVLRSQPPRLTVVDATLPRALDRLVAICLEKDPHDRWVSAHDVQLMLEGIRDEPSAAASAPARAGIRRRDWIAWTAVAGVAVAAAALVGRRPPVERPLDLMAILPGAGIAITPGEAPRVSPDGRAIAFVGTDESGRTLLYVRDRASIAPRALVGTDDASQPFWSPDSRALGFFAGGKLKRISASGGASLTLADTPVPRGGDWTSDGSIVFVPYPGEPPYRMPAGGGAATALPVPPHRNTPPEVRWFPSFLPDGHHYLYLSTQGTSRRGNVVRVGSIDSADHHDLVESGAAAAYVDPGYVMFRRERSLMVQPIDLRSLALTGTATTLVDRIGFSITYQNLASASKDGVLAYMDVSPGEQLVWFDSTGRRIGPATPPGSFNSLCLAPDGSAIFDATEPGGTNIDIWKLPPGGTPQRLTFDEAVDFYVACSPVAGEIVFSSLRNGFPALFRQDITAPGSEHVLLRMPGPLIATDWSHDGGRLVYSTFGAHTSWDIWTLPLPNGKPAPFLATAAEERNARLSPDGRWMAYTSNEEGGFEVYVQPFPATGAKWQISRGGGREPVWRPDGTQLFYVSPDRKIVGVAVKASGRSFGPGAPHVVVDTRVAGWERTNQGSPYAMTPDGQRFLVSSETEAARPITVMINWPRALAH